MRSVGIIAEYNPFHNGHQYHLQQSLEMSGAEISIAVISGNFTQRGEPALLDKWTRAKIAARNGVNLVIEMPFLFACNNAGYFARGQVWRFWRIWAVIIFLSEVSREISLFCRKFPGKQRRTARKWKRPLKWV